MKKVLISVIVSGGMILGGTATASAATKAPSITKPTAAAEGTATHEMSETSTTQKTEAATTEKKLAKKTHEKSSKHKNAISTKKK